MYITTVRVTDLYHVGGSIIRKAEGVPWYPSCCPLRPILPHLQRGKAILGVIYGVLLWADMNAATPLGAWGRSVISLGIQA